MGQFCPVGHSLLTPTVFWWNIYLWASIIACDYKGAMERTNEWRPKSSLWRKLLLFHSWRCPLALSAAPPWWNLLADMQLRPGKGGSSLWCILTFYWEDTGEPLDGPAWGWSFGLAKHWSCGKERRALIWGWTRPLAVSTVGPSKWITKDSIWSLWASPERGAYSHQQMLMELRLILLLQKWYLVWPKSCSHPDPHRCPPCSISAGQVLPKLFQCQALAQLTQV